MNKEKLLKVLIYARTTVKHPESPKYITPMYTDANGIIMGCPPNIKSLQEEHDKRISKIEEYEQFVKDINELIKENE